MNGLEQVQYRNKYIDTSSQRLKGQSVGNIEQRKIVKKLEFTKYEYCVSAVVLIVVVAITMWNLIEINSNEHMKRAIDSISADTMRVKNQTNNILDEIKVQYDYTVVKEAAEAQGLILQKGNVKDLSK